MKRSKSITLLFLGIALTACGQEKEERKDGFWTAGDDTSFARSENTPQPTFNTPPPPVATKKEDGSFSFNSFFVGYLLAQTLNNNSGYSSHYNHNSYPSVSPRREEERTRTGGSAFVYMGSGGGSYNHTNTAAAPRNFLSAANQRMATNTPITRPSSLPPPVRTSVPSVRSNSPPPPAAAPINSTPRGGFGTTASSRSHSVAS